MALFAMGTRGHYTYITMLTADWSISTSHDTLPSSCYSEKMLWNTSVVVAEGSKGTLSASQNEPTRSGLVFVVFFSSSNVCATCVSMAEGTPSCCMEEEKEREGDRREREGGREGWVESGRGGGGREGE